MNQPSTTPEQALRGELEVLVREYTARGHGATVADLIQSVTSGTPREEHLEFLFKYFLGLQRAGQACSAGIERLLIELFRKANAGELAVKPDFFGRILKRIQEQPDVEKVQWIGHLKVHLQRAVETRTTSTRRQVQAVAAVPPSPGVDVTLANVPQSLQEAKRDLLKQELMPHANQYAEQPEQCVDGLKKILSRQTGATLIPLIIDLSGRAEDKASGVKHDNGRLLFHPLYLVGQALIELYEAGNPYVKGWFDNGQQSRLASLRQGVSFYAAEHAKDRMVDFLRTFQASYPTLPPHYLPHATSQLALSLHPLLQKYPNACRGIAQMLLATTELSPAQEAIGKVVIEQSRTLVKEQKLSPASYSAVKQLAQKLRRRAKQNNDAPQQAVMADVEADASAALSQTIAKRERDAARAPQAVSLQGLASTAVDLLQREIVPTQEESLNRDKEAVRRKAQHFIDAYLRPSLQKDAESLHIDLSRSSLKFLGSGTESIVVEMFDTRYGEIAMRFDILGLHDEDHAQRNLRSIALLEDLKHPNIITSYGFDTVSVEVEVPTGKTKRKMPVTLTCQRLELIKQAQGLEKVIEQLNGNPPSPEAFRRIGYQLADALAFCHGMGIVHRDLKPENILIIPPEDGAKDLDDFLRRGHLKIIDFGAARDSAQGEVEFTKAKNGAGVGTPPYSAPECLMDSKASRNRPGDMYSLGQVLFELASGQMVEHATEYSYAEDPNFSGLTRSKHALYQSIAALQPSDRPTISRKDPHLKKFQEQNNPTPTLTGKQVQKMAVNAVIKLEQLGDPDPEKRPKADDVFDFFENPLDSSFVQFESNTPPRGQRALKKTGRRVATPETASEEEAPAGGVMAVLKKLRNMLPF